MQCHNVVEGQTGIGQRGSVADSSLPQELTPTAMAMIHTVAMVFNPNMSFAKETQAVVDILDPCQHK